MQPSEWHLQRLRQDSGPRSHSNRDWSLLRRFGSQAFPLKWLWYVANLTMRCHVGSGRSGCFLQLDFPFYVFHEQFTSSIQTAAPVLPRDPYSSESGNPVAYHGWAAPKHKQLCRYAHLCEFRSVQDQIQIAKHKQLSGIHQMILTIFVSTPCMLSGNLQPPPGQVFCGQRCPQTQFTS